MFYKNKPLPFVTVKYWCKQKDGKLVTQQNKTNKNGVVYFNHEEGETMISCVKMERINNNDTAQWQSYWGSLSFYYRKGNLFKKSVQ